MEDWMDNVSRSMAEAKSRRAMLRALAGGLAATALGALGVRKADAQTGRADCNLFCDQFPPGSLRDSCLSSCVTAAGDLSKMCVTFVDTTTDINNCGACGNKCSSGQTCTNGVCVCGAGQAYCSGACIGILTDDSNCGGCGNVCTGGSSCVNGTCTCSAGLTLCSGLCISTTTPVNCGACGNICPGYQQPNDNVTCNSAQTCTFSCQGEHYDVDNDPSNGCEQTVPNQGIHTQAAAKSLGSQACTDSISTTFTGKLLSDKRVHENPSINGFNPSTGSAPDWWVVNATGGTFCQDDLAITMTITGSSSPTCYKITVVTNKSMFTATANASGVATITGGSSSYSDGTPIYFKIEKTCGTNVTEAANYSVTFHL